MSRIRAFWRVLNAPCREHSALISRDLDGELDGASRTALRLHELYCRGCRRLRAHFEMLSTVAKSAGTNMKPAPAKGEPMPSEVRERIRERLKNRAV